MIYVVTSVHNRYAITKKFVEQCKEQTVRDQLHLILVDDGSTDGTDQMVRSILPDSTILYGNGNLWWAGGLQKAYDWIVENQLPEEDVVLITNDDTRFASDYMETGIRLIMEHPNTLVVGTGYGIHSGEMLDGVFTHSYVNGSGSLLPPDSEGNCASTRSLFLTVGAWKKIGGFHPVLLPHYASDFEFTIRAHKKGFRIRSFQELTLEFDEGTTGANTYDRMTVKKLFSKRSNSNPFYKISFIILTTPVYLLPVHLCWQIGRYIHKIGIFVGIIKRSSQKEA
jgi:GT2 family glycosyltransferase